MLDTDFVKDVLVVIASLKVALERLETAVRAEGLLLGQRPSLRLVEPQPVRDDHERWPSC